MALPERILTSTPILYNVDLRVSESDVEGRDTLAIHESTDNQFRARTGSVAQNSLDRCEPAELLQDPVATNIQNPAPVASPTFSEAFTRFEPMFHTVFYRKYHPDVRDDAKQVALLALFLKWSKDQSIFDQSASFVVTAAVWGISNWRKKEMKRLPFEKPLVEDGHGYVLGAPRGSQEGRWTDRIDFQIDLERAIDAVLWEFNDHPQYKAIYRIACDLVDDVPFTESWKKTNLPRGDFKRHRDEIRIRFAFHLAEYEPT